MWYYGPWMSESFFSYSSPPCPWIWLSEIWNPQKIGLVDKIKKVLRQFLCSIAYKYGGQPISFDEMSCCLLLSQRDNNDVLITDFYSVF